MIHKFWDYYSRSFNIREFYFWHIGKVSLSRKYSKFWTKQIVHHDNELFENYSNIYNDLISYLTGKLHMWRYIWYHFNNMEYNPKIFFIFICRFQMNNYLSQIDCFESFAFFIHLIRNFSLQKLSWWNYRHAIIYSISIKNARKKH